MSLGRSSCVVGIDVGGTNTDAVILRDGHVIEWYKTPTTPDIQTGVEQAIQEVLRKAGIPSYDVDSVKIGTTQFVNAVLEQNASKLDKVAVIRLCGPYSRGSPPFVDFPPTLRSLMEGLFGYVDGGFQVDGAPLSELSIDQLKEQASIIKSKSIKRVVVIGIYSPSNPEQENTAQEILKSELGHSYDITCSHAIGRLSFLERENASILNASLRRFSRHVIAGFSLAVRKLGLRKEQLYISLNDGTLSKASIAADYPVRCFSSGPTNSARGAALLAQKQRISLDDDREVLVIDVGGTTTDICALLKSGYPRQSAAFVKIAGVRTNFTIPDVHSIALGGGSIVRVNEAGWTSIGPDSVGSELDVESIAFGGQTLTATDLAFSNNMTELLVQDNIRSAGQREIQRIVEEAIDLVKTRQGDATVILVGGGSIIINEHIAGVGDIIRPANFEVANAVGAAIGKISGVVDKVVVPGTRTIDQEIEIAKTLATERCIAAGGDIATVEIVEIEVVPVSYTTNGATKIAVRVVGDLIDGHEESPKSDRGCYEEESGEGYVQIRGKADGDAEPYQKELKGSSYDIINQIDLESYHPKIEGNIWYLSELDLDFLMDGAGVLGVGSCGEPYPSYLACKLALCNGEELRIMRQDTIADNAVVLAAGFMGSPSVYQERVPGLEEITQAMRAVMTATGLASFDAVVPTEIGGLNAFEALLAAIRFKKSALDTDTVARAYPMVFQTVRCLNGGTVTPSAVADGNGNQEVIPGDQSENNILLTYQAWSLGRSIAIARSQKKDVASSLLQAEDGALLFTGKIISVTREVANGFTRGSVLLERTSLDDTSKSTHSLLVDFENENLVAFLRSKGEKDKVLACCPDLITFLDLANGAPLGVSDYKYGLRVSVVALRAPPMWATERGLEMGGPRAFGYDIEYKGVGRGAYKAPLSVFELFAA
ncbi:MAG: hypothetical protein M1818_005580 [Claussenomyces sp. TS43310]|nr:MAG: hypothetical protein M1818_005580 [Claussenomyces sp. TS43310]